MQICVFSFFFFYFSSLSSNDFNERFSRCNRFVKNLRPTLLGFLKQDKHSN